MSELKLEEIRERAEREIAVWKDLAPKGKPWHFRMLSKQWTVQEVSFLLGRITDLEAAMGQAAKSLLGAVAVGLINLGDDVLHCPVDQPTWKERAEKAEARVAKLMEVVEATREHLDAADDCRGLGDDDAEDRLDSAVLRLVKVLADLDADGGGDGD